MATTILAIGNTSLTSSEFTVATGDTSMIYLTASGAAITGGTVDVQIKRADANFTTNNTKLAAPGVTDLLLPSGTYRLVRAAQASSVGVDRT